MIEVDVLVAGAGPAGSTCAYLLQQAGHSCLLTDPAEFPRDKICGGGLTPRGWAIMDRLYPQLDYDYVPVHWAHLYINGKYRGKYHMEKEIRVVRRKAFDKLLLDEYLRIGGQLLKDRVWEVREREDGTIEVSLLSGEKVHCRYLVGADGANSRVRQYLNPASKPRVLIFEQYNRRSGTDEITFELANKYKNGYYYLFPNKDYDINGYCELGSSREKFAGVLDSFGIEKTQTLGAFITTDIDYPYHPHILLVGDAGCWCDCLSYEGIYFALATGENAALAILENRPFEEVNAPILKKKLHRNKAAKLLYNPIGLAMVKLISRHQDRTERILNRYLQ